MSPAVVVAMLTVLLGLQPVSTDLYLPALPLLQGDLGTSLGAAQATLSALVIAFGLGQLVCGPLADRHGRRPVLLGGLSLYTLASLLSAAAPDIATLVACRALQGAALAAAVTCGRSIVRDLYRPHDGARAMSRALGGLGVIATLSPLVGGLLANAFGWRAAMLATAAFGAATLVFVARRFRETLARPDPRAGRPATVLRNWRAVLADPTFRAWTALLCCTYGGVFFLLAGSSFVLIELRGMTRVGYGAVLATNSLAYIAGTVACRALLRRYGLRGASARGAVLSLCGSLAMAGLALAGVDTVWAIWLPQLVYSVGHGVAQPCGQAGALGPFPDKAGTAASLSGFAMMATAFAISLWLGHTLGASALPLTLGIGAAGTGVAAVAWTLVRRHGEPVAGRPPDEDDITAAASPP